MTTEKPVLTIDKPHFKVKLHTSLLEVDLKKGLKKELEDALESKPAIRTSLGFIFQAVIPLDVPLKDIESVELDRKGRVKIAIPSRRDIVIPLTKRESQRLIEKLNILIPPEKERALRSQQEARKVERVSQRGRAISSKEVARGQTTK